MRLTMLAAFVVFGLGQGVLIYEVAKVRAALERPAPVAYGTIEHPSIVETRRDAIQHEADAKLLRETLDNWNKSQREEQAHIDKLRQDARNAEKADADREAALHAFLKK